MFDALAFWIGAFLGSLLFGRYAERAGRRTAEALLRWVKA